MSEHLDRLYGTRFAGRFHVRERLGTGGMSVVYRAQDEVLGRGVALKLLHPGLGESPEIVARFKREMRACARLEHPGIVHTYEYGESEEGRLYLAMELLPGRTLAQVIEDEAPLEPTRVARIAEQLASALAAAHAAGVMHRDLKPGNIVLVGEESGQDRCVILDFGLSRFIEEESDRITASDAVVGTPRYMAPEYLATYAQDERGDLYGLGMVVYEMATGSTPYTGRLREVIDQMLHGQPPAPSTHVELPQWLDDLVVQCLARHPEDRPDSAGEVAWILRGELGVGEESKAYSHLGLAPVALTVLGTVAAAGVLTLLLVL